jgi:hypothetical protein
MIFLFPSKQEILNSLPTDCGTFSDPETNERIAKAFANTIGTERHVRQLLWDIQYDLNLGLTKDAFVHFERNWMRALVGCIYKVPKIGTAIVISCIATLIFTRLGYYYMMRT